MNKNSLKSDIFYSKIEPHTYPMFNLIETAFRSIKQYSETHWSASVRRDSSSWGSLHIHRRDTDTQTRNRSGAGAMTTDHYTQILTKPAGLWWQTDMITLISGASSPKCGRATQTAVSASNHTIQHPNNPPGQCRCECVSCRAACLLSSTCHHLYRTDELLTPGTTFFTYHCSLSSASPLNCLVSVVSGAEEQAGFFSLCEPAWHFLQCGPLTGVCSTGHLFCGLDIWQPADSVSD